VWAVVEFQRVGRFSDKQNEERTNGDRPFILVTREANNLDIVVRNVSGARPGRQSPYVNSGRCLPD